MQQLEEGVLTIVAQLAPDDRAGRGRERCAVIAHRLAVAFHFKLLEEGGEILERFVVGQHGQRPGTEEAGVPQADQAHHHRQVALEGRCAEMLVHALGASEHFVECLRADGDHQRQADRRPQRIATADPIPDREHQILVDAEFDGALRLARHGGEMVLQDDIRAQIGLQPVARGSGVEQGFLRGEGLADDDEQRRAWIEGLQQRGQLGAVEVGNVMHPQGRMPDRAQGIIHHLRAKVGATDADIDHVLDWLTLMPGALAAAQTFGEGGHAPTGFQHFRHDVKRLAGEGPLAAPQGDVQHRAVFGVVEVFTSEHALNACGKSCLLGQRGQQRQGFTGHALLGEVVIHSLV